MILPSLAEFFLLMLYMLVGSIVLAACIIIVGMACAELYKRWPE